MAALLYPLIKSAKLCPVETRAYLREATVQATWNPETFRLARDFKSAKIS